MYLIALCDDEAAELEKTEKLLSDYEETHSGADFVIRCFYNAQDLLYLIEAAKYMPDLIFMDIYMPTPRVSACPAGISAAKELRSMNYKGKIVFLTTSKEYALDAFDVDALQYIVKPLSADKLFALLDGLLQDIEEERKKYILIKVDGRLVRVSINDIIYCEAQGKMQCLHLTNGAQCTVQMTMSKVYELLAHYREFVKIGISFIVNLGYISSLSTEELFMDNGARIHLPRGTYKSLREQYFNYYCGERA